MGQNNRFLDISYMLHTLRLKWDSMRLRSLRNPYPYDYFKNNSKQQNIPNYSVHFEEQYLSLMYMNFDKAEIHHAGEKSITQELILGLIYWNEHHNNGSQEKEGLIKIAENIRNQATIEKDTMTFYIYETNERFNLNGKHFSGIVQGKAASFFVRCYIATKDKKYLTWTNQCLNAALIPVEEEGILRTLSDGSIWIEEYPSPKPSMVLNGHLFYCIGLAEYLSFRPDETLQTLLDQCLQATSTWMPNYLINGQLLYSMYRWNLCNIHYTGIMKFQFDHLYRLTGMDIFKTYSEIADSLTNWKTFNRIL